MKKMSIAAAFVLGLATLGAAEIAAARPQLAVAENGASATLTQTQREEAKKAFEEQKEKTAPLREQLAAKRAELKTLSMSETPDEAKVRETFREIADLKASLFLERANFRAEMEKKGLGEALGRRDRSQEDNGPRFGHHGDRRGHRDRGC